MGCEIDEWEGIDRRVTYDEGTSALLRKCGCEEVLAD